MRLFLVLFLLSAIFWLPVFSVPNSMLGGLDDVSFCIADLKIGPANQINILEFGDGALSGYKGYDTILPRGRIWQKFWHYLARFSLPIWFLGTYADHKKPIALDVLRRLGGTVEWKFERMLAKMARDASHFATYKSEARFQYKPLVFLKVRSTFDAYKKKILEYFPKAIVVGGRTRLFVCNKQKTDQLFSTKKLKNFRPSCKICSKIYSKEVVAEILEFIKSDILVVKPLDAGRGNGILFTKRDQLDRVVSHICATAPVTRRASESAAYNFWQTDQNDHFLVEEYVPSRIIEVQGKPYDATIRIAFTMHRVNGQVRVHILDGYWKLPYSPLMQGASLSDIFQSEHLTYTSLKHDKRPRAAVVDKQDMQFLGKRLVPVLQQVYKKMLE